MSRPDRDLPDRNLPDRSRPPAPGERKPCPFPSFESERLKNGLRLLVAPVRAFPILTAELVVMPAGAQHDPPESPGLARLHGSLLTEGTNRYTGPELAVAIERLGGSLSSGADQDLGWTELDVLTANADAGLDLLAETTRRSIFPEDQVERLRAAQHADLSRRRTTPQLLAEDVFTSIVYQGTPYAHPLAGVPEAVESFDRDRVAAFHERHFVPRGSALVAVGDLDPERLRDRVEALWGDWHVDPASEPIAEPNLEPTEPESPRVVIVDRPGASQTALHLGHGGLPRNHPDIHAVMVTNVLFGGKFTSRLNLNLRERHGFTYGVNSLFARRRGPGPFSIRAAVATDVAGAAVRETLHEIERLHQSPPDAEELRETQDYMLGVFAYTLQTITDVGNRLESLVVHDLPDDYYDTYPGVLGEVTAEEILDVARRHIRPDRLVIVACGPAEDLRPQLETFGSVEVVKP